DSARARARYAAAAAPGSRGGRPSRGHGPRWLNRPPPPRSAETAVARSWHRLVLDAPPGDLLGDDGDEQVPVPGRPRLDRRGLPQPLQFDGVADWAGKSHDQHAPS